MAQHLKPIADVLTAINFSVVGGDGSTAIYPVIGEEPPNDDASYVGLSADGEFRVLLSVGNMPSRRTNHTLRFRARYEEVESPQATSIQTITATIYQGDTIIGVSPTYEITTTYTTYSHVITRTQASSITDYTNLRYKIEAVFIPNQGRITWLEFEVPEKSVIEESAALAKSVIRKGYRPFNGQFPW